MIEIVSPYIDTVAVFIAMAMLSIAQTKTSLITACEFVAYNLYSFVIYKLEITSPMLWYGFVLIPYISCHFHVICTSHRLVVASFFIPFVYNLVVSYEWQTGNYGIFDYYYTYAMWAAMLMQLLTTAIYGGLKDGLLRWGRNIADRNIPYLRINAGS